MANWKKIIVSGSSAHLAAVTVSGLTNDNIIVAGTGGVLESSGLTYNGSVLGLGTKTITSTGAASILSGSFSGSFQGDGSGLTGLPTTLNIAGDSGTDGVSLLNDTFTIDGGTGLTSTVTNNQVSIGVDNQGITETQLHTSVAGTGISGGNGTALSVDYGSSAGTAVQGSTTITINGTSGEIGVTGTAAQALGGGPSYTLTLPDTISGNRTFSNSVTIQGDLIVTGNTTEQQVTNLNVEDKFILLASGSAGAGDGGLIIDQGGKKGEALAWDAATSRFATTGSLASDAPAFVPDAFVAMVVDQDNGSTDVAKYQKRGNIKVDTSDDIWIYV